MTEARWTLAKRARFAYFLAIVGLVLGSVTFVLPLWASHSRVTPTVIVAITFSTILDGAVWIVACSLDAASRGHSRRWGWFGLLGPVGAVAIGILLPHVEETVSAPSPLSNYPR